MNRTTTAASILIAAALVVWPASFGGSTPGGRAIVELSAWTMFALAFANRSGTRSPPAARVFFGACVVLLGLAALQTVPLPFEFADRLAPSSRLRALVRNIETLPLPGPGAPSVGPLAASGVSVAPQATWDALRLGLAFLAIAATVAKCTRDHPTARRWIAWGALAGAGLQGLYGSLAVLTGADTLLGVPKLHYLDSATGTFVNRNHYASYLAGSLALGAALFAADLARERRSTVDAEDYARRWARAGVQFALLGLGIAGLALSLSRAGIAVGLAALAAVAWRVPRSGARGLLAAVAMAGLALAASVAELAGPGIGSRLARVAADAKAPGGRVAVWRDLGAAIAEHPVAGAGLGTFDLTYPAYRSPAVTLDYDHAHNEVLELAFGTGGAGVACASIAVLALLAAGAANWRRSHDPLAVGATAGSLALLAHAGADFALHLPAVGALAAVSCGFVLGSRANPPAGPRPVEPPSAALPPGLRRSLGGTAVFVALSVASTNAWFREARGREQPPGWFDVVLGPSAQTRTRTASVLLESARRSLDAAGSVQALEAASSRYRETLTVVDRDLLASVRLAPTRSAALARLLAVRWEASGTPSPRDRDALLRGARLAAAGAPHVAGIQLDVGRLCVAAGAIAEGAASLRAAVASDPTLTARAVAVLAGAGVAPRDAVEVLGGGTAILLAARPWFATAGDGRTFFELLAPRLEGEGAEAVRSFAAVGRDLDLLEEVVEVLEMLGERPTLDAELERALSLGESYAALGRHSDALEWARRAASNSAADAPELERAARLHLDLRVESEAEVLVRRAIERAALAPTPAVRRARLYALLGLTLDRQRRPAEAFDAYRRATALDPEQPTATRRLAEMRGAAAAPLDGPGGAP